MPSATQCRAEAVVAFPPIEVWQAFTRPAHVSYWLGDALEIDLRVGGAYIVRCSSGARLDTTVERLLEGRRLVLRPTRRGDDDRIEIDLIKLSGAETRVIVCDPDPAALDPWRDALTNLRSVWERGVDLREARQPVMGIGPRDLGPADRPVRGVPPGVGVRLHAVLRGGPADKAGFRPGDVVIAFTETPVATTPELVRAIQSRKPGDTVELRSVRDGQETVRTVILGLRRGRGEPPPDRDRLVAALREDAIQADLALEKSVEGIAERDAYRPERPDAWSVAQVLAHLSVTERMTQCWLDHAARGGIATPDSDEVTNPERLAAVLESRPTVTELVNRVKRDEQETLSYMAHLPATVTAFKPRWCRVALLALDYHAHSAQHLAQIARIRQTLNV